MKILIIKINHLLLIVAIWFNKFYANLLAPILKNVLLVNSDPKVSATIVKYLSASWAVWTPPATFTPTFLLFLA